MSKIGKKPITIPEGVNINVVDNVVTIKGAKGEIQIPLKPSVSVAIENNQLLVSRKNDAKTSRALHGTIRSLINNAVTGITTQYSKTLKLIGTGYRVKAEGKNISLSLGFSHPVVVEPVAGIEFKIDGQDTIIVSGIDKQLVGQIAANIRSQRPPEPYKGKGIRYQDEYVARKAGKTAKAE